MKKTKKRKKGTFEVLAALLDDLATKATIAAKNAREIDDLLEKVIAEAEVVG